MLLVIFQFAFSFEMEKIQNYDSERIVENFSLTESLTGLTLACKDFVFTVHFNENIFDHLYHTQTNF